MAGFVAPIPTLELTTNKDEKEANKKPVSKKIGKVAPSSTNEGFKNDIAVLKKDNADLKKDIAVLKKDNADLKKDNADFKRDVNKKLAGLMETVAERGSPLK